MLLASLLTMSETILGEADEKWLANRKKLASVVMISNFQKSKAIVNSFFNQDYLLVWSTPELLKKMTSNVRIMLFNFSFKQYLFMYVHVYTSFIKQLCTYVFLGCLFVYLFVFHKCCVLYVCVCLNIVYLVPVLCLLDALSNWTVSFWF